MDANWSARSRSPFGSLERARDRHEELDWQRHQGADIVGIDGERLFAEREGRIRLLAASALPVSRDLKFAKPLSTHRTPERVARFHVLLAMAMSINPTKLLEETARRNTKFVRATSHAHSLQPPAREPTLTAPLHAVNFQAIYCLVYITSNVLVRTTPILVRTPSRVILFVFERANRVDIVFALSCRV